MPQVELVELAQVQVLLQGEVEEQTSEEAQEQEMEMQGLLARCLPEATEEMFQIPSEAAEAAETPAAQGAKAPMAEAAEAATAAEAVVQLGAHL